MIKLAVIAALTALMPAAAMADTVAQRTSLPTPWQASDGDVIAFEVLRKGKPFGSHILSFDKTDNGELKVTSDVDLDVKIGPLTVFKYRLDAVETWQDGQLVALKGKTNNDGDKKRVEAKAAGDALKVDGSAFSGEVPASIIPSSHWNIMQVYGDRMLSTESGEVLDIDVENLGTDTVTVDGAPVETTHYRLKSDMTVDLWYDNQSRWVKLSFEAQGQNIDYVLSELY